MVAEIVRHSGVGTRRVARFRTLANVAALQTPGVSKVRAVQPAPSNNEMKLLKPAIARMARSSQLISVLSG
jgi:hypothetical protein